MMRKIWFLLIFLAGCTHQEDHPQQAKLHENGTAKPVVAIVPLIDNSKHTLPWDLSNEMTSSVHYRLMQKDTLYLVDNEKINSMMKRVKESHHPFDTDFSWMKKIFLDDEFVVFMELMHYEHVPIPMKETGVDQPTELAMQVRIRVVDLREEEPKIALQEIIKDAHFIPKQFSNTNFTQVEWGKENYSISPIGMAHAHISKEIATRLEEYILLAMNRKR